MVDGKLSTKTILEFMWQRRRNGNKVCCIWML